MKLHTSVLMLTVAGTIVLGGATTAYAQDGPCSDPWISKAIHELEGRPAIGAGNLGECMPSLYVDTTKTTRGKSAFKSYTDAQKKVAATSKMLRGQGYRWQANPAWLATSNSNIPRFNPMQGNGILGNNGGMVIVNNSGNFRRGDKSIAHVFDLPGGRKLIVRDAPKTDPGM